MKHAILMFLALCAATVAAAESPPGKVVETTLVSQVLRGNRIGIDPQRTVMVYLPPGYEHSRKTYPVLYYFHNIFWSSRQLFTQNHADAIFDRAIAQGRIADFILVAADFTTPHVGTFFGNAEATGRWLDFISTELVPFVDGTYRTLPRRESRGLTGDFLGGYVALKLAMLHPEQFGAVYALHPVGTGKGLLPAASRLDWQKMNAAKSWEDLAGDGYAQVFMAMAQANLPNPDRPPFYCDLMFESHDGAVTMNLAHVQRLWSSFSLDSLLQRHVDSLKRMKAVALDWGRYDANADHVYANQSFTRELDAVGIEHFAEEYRGNAWDQLWVDHGRVEDRMLPFFGRYLEFEPGH